MALKLPPTFVKGFHEEGLVSRMQYAALGTTNLHVSHLGFGGAAIGSHYDPVGEAEGVGLVREALKAGVNYIDTAPWYGSTKAETVLGKALEGIPREAYYVATKVGRYGSSSGRTFDFGYKRTLESVDESLGRLGLSYIDVIQVHDLEFAPSLEIVFRETLPALQEVVRGGKARFIGITGYPLHVLQEAVEKSPVRIDTVLSYCRNNLHDTSLQDHLRFFQDRDVGLIDAAPTSMGLLSASGPPPWHPAGAELKEACTKANLYCQSQQVELARLAVHYTLTQPGASSHLVSCHSMQVLQQNLNTLYHGLNEKEERVLEHVLDRFMKPLRVKNWENIEVEKYWKKINKLKSSGME